MPGGFDSHADYMAWVQDDATARRRLATEALRVAFGPFIEMREAEVVNFSTMTALDLAHAIGKHPLILKPIFAACNVAARAIERDLDICNLDAYKPRLSAEQAAAIAGYLKPFLPQELAVSALTELDRHFFVDKQVRMLKGRWERAVRDAINEQAALKFKKRHVSVRQRTLRVGHRCTLDG